MPFFVLILFILLIAYGFLIDYYRRAWDRIPDSHDNHPASIKVSVIIAVRNESENIDQLLSCLVSQDYPTSLFEVIIVDDHSTDSTWQMLQQYDLPSTNLKFLQLPSGVTSKKSALDKGVRAATGELIMTTDADCVLPPGWISSIAAFYEKTKACFIAAPVLMEPTRSVNGIFQSLDFLTMQGITGAAVHGKFHTICNGANLAFKRSAFIEVNGFDGIDEIPSGDDMLLMHKIAIAYPGQVYYIKSKTGTVTTKPEKTWKDFLHQRIRWASKAVHFKDRNVFYVLLLTYIVNACFLVLGIVSIIHIYWLSFFVLFLAAKILIEFPFVSSVAIYFGQQKLMKYFPLLQPIHILYTVVAGWLGRFGSYDWKSRKIINKGRRKLLKQ